MGLFGAYPKDQAIWIHYLSRHIYVSLLLCLWSLCPNLLAGLIADFIAKQGNYENDKFNLLSYMIFSLGNLAPIVTMWLAPKAYIAQLLAKGKTQDYVDQVMVPFTTSHVLILIGGTLMAALIGGYIAKNWLKK